MWWGGRGITPLPSCPLSRGSPPHPCVRAGGGYPLPPSGPVRPATTNQKRPQAKPLRRNLHANNPVFPVQKPQASQIRRGGVIPHPPPPLSAQVGATPPPMWLSGWGVPPLGSWRDGSGTDGKHPDQSHREPMGNDDRINCKVKSNLIIISKDCIFRHVFCVCLFYRFMISL
jgi:hypothetical protein